MGPRPKFKRGMKVRIIAGTRAGRSGVVERPPGLLGLVRLRLDPLAENRIGLELVVEPTDHLTMEEP